MIYVGCMSAIHLCPFCKRQFEYSPQDYHRQIVCGHENCTKSSTDGSNNRTFGFYMFNTSDLVMRNFKAEVVQELNERATAKAAKKRRAERSSKRQEGHEDVNMDQVFTLGLVDTCSRCEDSLEYFDTGKSFILPPYFSPSYPLSMLLSYRMVLTC